MIVLRYGSVKSYSLCNHIITASFAQENSIVFLWLWFVLSIVLSNFLDSIDI